MMYTVSEEKNRGFSLRFIGFLTALGVISILASSARTPAKTRRYVEEHRAQPVATARRESREAHRNLEKKNEKLAVEASLTLIDAMTSAAQGDEEAGELLNMFIENSVRYFCTSNDMIFTATINGTGGNSLSMGRPNPLFKVFIAPMEMRAMHGFSQESDFVFLPREREMVIPDPKAYTKTWLGVIVIHEMVHVRDALHGIETPGTAGFYEGEVRAHSLEDRLLNSLTKDEYAKAVLRIADRIPRIVGFPSKNVHTFPWHESKEIDTMFEPVRSVSEASLRLAQYTFSVNMAYARKIGLGEDAGVEFYKHFHRPPGKNM